MSEYIDREAAIDALDKLCDLVCQYSKKQRGVMCAACNLGGAFDTIEQLPAADVVPARVFRDCRNELCLKCGAYKQRHEGVCDGCRWLVKTDDVLDRSLEEIRP